MEYTIGYFLFRRDWNEKNLRLAQNCKILQAKNIGDCFMLLNFNKKIKPYEGKKVFMVEGSAFRNDWAQLWLSIFLFFFFDFGNLK